MKRIAIVAGVRTPMAKAGSALKDIQADDLAAHVLREVVHRSAIDPQEIDEVICGNVAQPVHSANIA